MPYVKPSQLLVLLMVAGCASQPGKDHAATNASTAGTDTQCHSEALTGSLITKTVCTTKAQRDAQQALVGEVQNSTMQSVDGRSGK
jgi:hypothetical protein